MRENWRRIQAQNFRSLKPLLAFLGLEEDSSFLSSPTFPLNIPRRLAEKIEKKNLHDPLFKQFVPKKEETNISVGFSLDPVQDAQFQKTPRLLKKYASRALLLPTSACAMHCRFCFRQNYPYEKSAFDFSKELKLIEEDSSLKEIILSGGDPLSLSDATLSDLITKLGCIPHLKLLRFHTRFPIGIPERISSSFLDIIKASSLQPVFMIHVNHVNELDADIFQALQALRKAGATVFSQTVLLKDVNDTFQTLSDLFLALVQNGITPYYLHQLDRVQAAAHFEIPKEKGLKLIKKLRASLPGYAVPQYVEEVPHQKNKLPITSV